MTEIEDDLKRLHDNTSAYERLYKRTRDALLRRFDAMIPDALRADWDGEDLFEEAFIKAAGSIASFEWRGEQAWFGYVLVTASNIVKSALRRKPLVSARLVAAGDSRPGLRESRVPDPRSSATGAVARRDAVEEILRHLRPQDAELIRLKFYGALKDEEIAARVGKKANAVSKALQRALERFAAAGLLHLTESSR